MPLDTALAALTAFDTEAQLLSHVAAGGKAPSFNSGKPEQLALALALQGRGIPATLWG